VAAGAAAGFGILRACQRFQALSNYLKMFRLSSWPGFVPAIRVLLAQNAAKTRMPPSQQPKRVSKKNSIVTLQNSNFLIA
jgi:hypothetical protein